MPNPRSTTSIAGHPLHPMLVPFPIAFFVAAFICDLAFWRTGVSFWASASLWLLGAGLVMAALAAIVGLTDVLGSPGADKEANWLPAPEGMFFLILRTYLPAEDIVNQTWSPPRIIGQFSGAVGA